MFNCIEIFNFKWWWNQDVRYFDIIHPDFVKEERFPQSLCLIDFYNTSAS